MNRRKPTSKESNALGGTAARARELAARRRDLVREIHALNLDIQRATTQAERDRLTALLRAKTAESLNLLDWLDTLGGA